MSSTGYHYEDYDTNYQGGGDPTLDYASPASNAKAVSSDDKPRILLLGLRRGGKSSITQVVFHKMSPNETTALESTSKIVKNDISNSSFVQFQVWDAPGQLDLFDPAFDTEAIFVRANAIVFVIDAQDSYVEPLEKLKQTIIKAHRVNPSISFEVFIHKVDGLADETKMETQRELQQLLAADLSDARLEHIHPSFYLTSIYDHTIFEAFSKVVQKLIPQLPTLENLLDILISNCRIEKAFLIDVVSKIYVATDSSPVDMQTYELCSDMIDVVIDVSCVYGMKPGQSEGLAYDEHSQSVIKLSNGTVLFLREVNRYLALVCVIRESDYNKHGLVAYNFDCLKKAIADVFAHPAPAGAGAPRIKK